MPIPKKIVNFLQTSKVKHDFLEHKKVYTAFDKSKTLGLKPKFIAKSLALKLDNQLVLALIPANKNLDKNKFKEIFNVWCKKQGLKPAKKADFATERLMKNRFKGVKLGVLPPFGNIFKCPTFAVKSLLGKDKIVFNSGDYRNSILIKGEYLYKLIPDLAIGNFAKSKA